MERHQLSKLLCFIFLFFSLLKITYADPTLPKPVGRVAWVKGTLTATMENKEVRTLQKMSVIYLQDVLRTGENSQAQIAFTDGTMMTFYPKSQLNVQQYNFTPNKGKGSVGKYVMQLIEGGFRTITGLIAKRNPSDYQVNTPVATIGVRGTDYAVYIQNGELYVGYYSGQPCVTGTDANRTQMCLNEQNKYARVGENMAPVPLSQQPAIFSDKLAIIPFELAPFGARMNTGGTVSSFCIMQ